MTAEIVAELPEEIIENRRKFIAALKASRNQCHIYLFESYDNYDNSGRARHFRCAVGVAMTVFFGIRTEADYNRWAEGVDDPYEAVAEKLGVHIARDEGMISGFVPVTIADIWTMNDDDYTFRAIAQNIQERWGL